MMYEGQEFCGLQKINEKIMSISAETLQFVVTSVDCQPVNDTLLVFVCGQLMVRLY